MELVNGACRFVEMALAAGGAAGGAIAPVARA
jgi:hypothetical protein